MYPVLFQIGGLEIRAWGLMVSLGILAGTLIASKLAKKEGLDAELIYDYVIYVVIAGILGARLWEVIFSLPKYYSDPVSALKFWVGGLSIQGAVAGGLLFTIWFIKRHNIDFWHFADCLAPGLILGQAIGRIGCFLNGDAFGIPTSSWFGVSYKPGTPAFDHYGPIALIPAELFEGAGDLIIFGILLFLFNRRPFKGVLTLLYFVLYSLLRFTLEFWRGDSLLVADTLKAAQISSLVVAVAALVIAVVKFRSAKD